MTALDPRPRTLEADASVLVDAALDGDEMAWRQLRDRFGGQVRAVASARVRDRDAVEDIVQETFLRAWMRIHQLDDAERVGPWLKTIAARAAIDHIRAQRPTVPLDLHIERPLDLAPLEDHVVEREAAAVLHGRLAELRESDRVALWQRDALGVPVADVADQLGMTAGSVRVLLSRARGKLRQGYGVLALPVIGVVGRVRSRVAGLGEALPVAVLAPALVMSAVVGVSAVGGESLTESSTPQTSIAAAPASDVSAMALTPIERAGASGTTRVTPPTEPVVQPVVASPAGAAEADAAPAAEPDAQIVAPGDAKVTVGGDGPEEEPDERIDPQSPVGGVDGVELYFGDDGPAGTSCLLGADCD